MTDPATQHLYILQNEFGCFKIGRSVEVERRRLQLQSTERCRIAVVDVYLECGDMEEGLHIDLADFRLAGEWFEGTDEARAALHELIGDDEQPFSWPFAFDPDGAADWLDHLYDVRDAAAISRELYRQIGILKQATEPSWVHDSGIFSAKYRAETGRRCFQDVRRKRTKVVCQWRDLETNEKGIVPDYTKDIQTALLVWPEDIRPETWVGSSIECCIAALTAIRARLVKVRRA